MGYRAWARAGTALLVAMTPHFSVFAQSAAPTNTVASNGVTSPTIVPVLNPAAQAALQKAIAGSQRIEPVRDRWRNPAATLQFFGVRPTDTVIEVWPGQGWYTSILGPYLKQGGGTLVIGHFDAASTNSSIVRQIVDAYRARFASDQGAYGSVSVVPFGPRSGALGMPGTADSVLTFRNIHNWMAQGWAEKAMGDFFLVLKPGGILGIEEHRGRTDEPQDPLARDGYVREDFVIQLAREAGFDFIGRSEINANPADTKDHPFGVWTLPPVSRSSPLGQRDDPGFERTRYDAIGESDRMTLRFRKPLSATGAPPAAGTRWSPVIVAPAPPAPPSAPKPTPPIVRPPIIRPSPATPAVVAPPSITPPNPMPRPAAPPPSPPPTPQLPPISSRPPSNGDAVAPRITEPAPQPKLPPAPVIVSPPVLAPPPIPERAPPVATPIPPPAIASAPSVPTPQAASQPAPSLPSVIETKPLAPVGLPASVPVLPTPPPPPPPTPQPDVQLPVPPIVAPPATQPIAPSSTSPPLVLPEARPAPVVTPDPKPLPAPSLPAPPLPMPQPRTAIVTPPVAKPPIVRPPAVAGAPTPAAPATRPPATKPPATRSPTVRASSPIPPAPATRPKPKAATPAPVVRPPTIRSPAPPQPKAKAKAPPPPPPRAAPRPAPPPIPKKKATPPVRDPNKPDWVVPRRRS